MFKRYLATAAAILMASLLTSAAIASGNGSATTGAHSHHCMSCGSGAKGHAGMKGRHAGMKGCHGMKGHGSGKTHAGAKSLGWPGS